LLKQTPRPSLFLRRSAGYNSGKLAVGLMVVAKLDASVAAPAAPEIATDQPSWMTPGEILESIGDAFYAIDRQWRFVYVNRMAEQLWGRRREDLLGKIATTAFPAWVGSESYLAHQRVMQSGDAQSIQTLSTVFGKPVEINIFPRPGGLSVYFRDVSERAKLEQELRERDEVLRLAEMSAGVGIWDMDMAQRTVRGTPQFFAIVGLPPTDEPVPIEHLRALRHPDDRDQVVNNFQRALDSGEDQYEAEYRILRPDGEVRWIFGRGRVFRDKDGKPFRYSGVDLDITQRKKYEEHLALTTRELSHRTKNILAVVQAMVRQIGRRSNSFEEFEARLNGCINALAHCHDLLVASDWQGADLRSLIGVQVAPFGGLDEGRFRADGPEVRLSPQAAQLVGLALHELATNAAKHGALTMPNGIVGIAWEMEAAGHAVRLSWREQDGPRVAPPMTKGFGHVVLERMAASLDTEVSLQFPADGAQWSVRIDGKHIVRQ
jgi:PAS domain S-box-containing protein